MGSSAAATLDEQGKVSIPAASVSRVLGRVIFGALLAIIVLTAIPYGSVEPWWAALFECAIFALTILWIVEGLLSGSWLVGTHTLLLPLLVLIAYGFAQTLPVARGEVAGIQVWQTISADPYQTRLVALKLLALTLAAALLLRYTDSIRRMRVLIYTVVGLGVLSALFGLIRQTTQHDSIGFVLPYLRLNSGYGQFINKNHFAFLAEMALGLAIGIVAGGVRRDQILIYLALALPVWTALVLSNSRGGLFSMLAQVLFLGLVAASLRSRGKTAEREEGNTSSLLGRFSRSVLLRAILLVCLVVLVFVGAIWMGGEPLVTRLETVTGEMSSANVEDNGGSSRKAIWRATWRLIKDHPILGVGFGGYWTAIPQYHEASGRVTPQEAHNDYLELMASGGIVGLGILVWFLFALIRSVRERLRLAKGFARAATIGAVTGIFGVAVHSFVDFGLHIPINALVLMALVCIATRDTLEASAQEEPSGLKPHT
jgi:O-antigen ligase